MTTPDAISQQIRTTLAATIPGLSCALGTPERKIIDAVLITVPWKVMESGGTLPADPTVVHCTGISQVRSPAPRVTALVAA